MPLRSTGPRTRESRAEHTRKLLEAAFNLIPEVGIAGLRTRDIADRAGVHLATFHYCFESKDALLVALYADLVDKIRNAIDTFVSPNHTASERLDGHRKLRKYMLVDNRHLLVAWHAFVGAIWTDPLIASIVRPHVALMRERMYPYIESGKREGLFASFKGVDVNISAAIVLGMYHAVLTQVWLDPDAVSLEDFEEALTVLYGA